MTKNIVEILNIAMGLVADGADKDKILAALAGALSGAEEADRLLSALSDNRTNLEAVQYFLGQLGF